MISRILLLKGGTVNELALFAGAGGGILGGHLAGWRCVCAVEREPYAAGILLARQNDGCLPRFPVWDDVRTFDGRRWRGAVDIVSGGFPCQDISAAGKGVGIDGERSGLWGEMARIIGEVLPRFVLVENSPLLVGRGLAVVLGDLDKIGYDAVWDRVGAIDAGAPHWRYRCWVVAVRRDGSGGGGEGAAGDVADALRNGWEGPGDARGSASVRGRSADAGAAGDDVADAGGGRCGEPSGREVEQPGRAEAERSGADVANAAGSGWPSGRSGSRRETDREIRHMRAANGGEDVADASRELQHGRGKQGGRSGQSADGGGEGSGTDVADALCYGAAEGSGGAGCQAGAATIRAGRGEWGQSADGGGAGISGEQRCGAGGDGEGWWDAEPAVGRVADGVAHRVGQLRALGNGQVAAVVRVAWDRLWRIWESGRGNG